MGNSVSKSGDFLIAISVEDSIQLSIRLRLAVQSALLGAVPAALREVSCGWEGAEIKLRFVFDGKIDPDDIESARTVSEEIIRIDYPNDLSGGSKSGDMLIAYRRKEHSTDGRATPGRNRILR
jgi:hypothetical protein